MQEISHDPEPNQICKFSAEVRRPAPGPAMTRRGERLVIILLAVNEEVLLRRQVLRLAQD
jgi:hypothetical protein